MVNAQREWKCQPFQIGADDGRAKPRFKPRKMQREDSMTSKVMVEVGDLEKLKEAIAAFEPWVSRGTTEHTRLLVDLAKRVVAEEERIQAAIAAPSDYERY
jgi:hexokinase